MQVLVVCPPDSIGANEMCFLYEARAASREDALWEARRAMETRATPGIRSLSIGDLLIIAEEYHIVNPTGFRRVSPGYGEQWRRRTLVERQIGSGEYERVRTGKTGFHVRVES